MRTANRFVPVLLLVALAMFLSAPYVIDAAPEESTMGLIQKIFYFHVPAAATAMLSAFVCGVASALYLWRRGRVADHVAVAAAELVVVFGIIVLVTGPIWARKAWGIWWAWNEPRLTITLVMWLIFVAYLLLRRFGGPGSDVLAAAVGLFGAVLVPFVYWSVNVWRGLHPKTTVVWTLQRDMMQPLMWGFAAFLMLYGALLIVRVRLEATRASLEDAWLALED